MAELLLNEEDKRLIEDAVRKAELGTSGEIVFAVTDSCGKYRSAALQGALGGMVVGTAIFLLLPVGHSIGMLLWSQLISFAASYALFSRWMRARRWFVPEREMEEKVRQAALLEFHVSGLQGTREANGILIFLSRFEHQVVVLGDRGIHERMKNPPWDELRDLIVSAIRKGEAVKGICAAVERCGHALSEHFPRREGDVNELPDAVIDRTSIP